MPEKKLSKQNEKKNSKIKLQFFHDGFSFNFRKNMKLLKNISLEIWGR